MQLDDDILVSKNLVKNLIIVLKSRSEKSVAAPGYFALNSGDSLHRKPNIGAFYRIHNANFTSGTQQNVPQHIFLAMFYLYGKLPEKYRDRFIQNNTEFIINKYANERILDMRNNSFIGKVKNTISHILNRINFLKK